MSEKNRTAEAALGLVDFDETLPVGPWIIGYLSIRRSEAKRVASVGEDRDAESTVLYEMFCRRFRGDATPTLDEFEDGVGQDELVAMLAWISGGDPDSVRLKAHRGEKVEAADAQGKKSES